ncbi:UDP-Glycosyltransferase superfamily protein [Striga asiatica]|uniref:Glycosyltransferase n=1 Tax=Striga asiatica TaxID=4170 RepID=A0A5A7QXK2_STRAF|nr:UDP-Glycosyltransferase superfamily protein [Striga asiatica]
MQIGLKILLIVVPLLGIASFWVIHSSSGASAFLSALPPGVDHILLPPVTFDDLPPDVKIETRISLTVTRSLPSINAALKTLIDGGRKPAALVVDLFGTDGFEAAAEFNIPPYIFFPSTAMTLSLFLHLPNLDETVSSEYWEVAEKLQIPGCIPIHGRDLLDPVQDRKNDAYKWVLHNAKRYRLARGIILNSFKELEPGPIEYLQGKESKNNGNPSVYPIGPLVQTGSPKPDSDGPSMKWLDEQPSGSVLFISFGSGGSLSQEQITELALGLELSEQRFLWVLRRPSGSDSNRDYFSIKDAGDPLAYLPEGFVERTKGRGLVLPLWAPQAKILAHGSVSAFLTHCGWNSILESVANGVPMIAWPLYAEQRMNAVLLHEDVKVALRPRAGENGLVGRVEIANVVKGLMEGEEGKRIRSRIRDLKNAACNALSEKGQSTNVLAQLAAKWNPASI